MDFSKTDEQLLMIENVREVMKRGDYDLYFKECDEKSEFPEKAAQDMVDAGFAALYIPEEYGGTPCDLLTLVYVMEEAHAMGWPSMTWPSHPLQVDTMLTYGTEAQKKLVLDLALKGIKPYTMGITEPQAGSDNSALATRIFRDEDGVLRITGTKSFNTGANCAPYMLCLVREYQDERPYKDMSQYLIPMDREGIQMSKINKIGNNMMHTYEVYLDNVEVHEDELVGEKGKGFYQLMKNFEVERLLTCVCSVGMARCAYNDAVAYANQREQFGKTIGSFQIIQEKITDMAIKIQNMQNMLYKATWKKQNGESISIETSLLKRYTGKAANEVIDDAMQILGGLGYTNESRVSRLWRDQRVYRIMTGTEEIMVHAAGRALIKQGPDIK